MNITVSGLSHYCAHCGHLEPINPNDAESCSLVYVHLDDCRCTDNTIAHDMFVALGNAMTHMDANEVLLKRADASILSAMKPFAKRYLTDGSFTYKWLNKDMTLKRTITTH